MSENNLTRLPEGSPKPTYYTANAGKRLTGFAPQTIALNVPPDAWAISVKGDKLYPLWLEASLRAWAAERRNLPAAPEAHDAR